MAGARNVLRAVLACGRRASGNLKIASDLRPRLANYLRDEKFYFEINRHLKFFGYSIKEKSFQADGSHAG